MIGFYSDCPAKQPFTRVAMPVPSPYWTPIHDSLTLTDSEIVLRVPSSPETCGTIATHLCRGMSEVRDWLIDQRDAAVRGRHAVQQEVNSLRLELNEKQQQLASLTSYVERIDRAIAALGEKQAPYVSIMDAVMEVLADRQEGMTANEILGEINARFFGGKVARSSLSPQLSRLKNRDHKIELRGNKWFALR